jgi:CubicO group peptidase (beta-lactamase class C family)
MPNEAISPDKLKCITKIVDTWLDYQLLRKRIPGLSVGIVHKDNLILSKGHGYANIERKIQATDKTLYRIASISKLFTAVAVMQLVEANKLRLDDHVDLYLPWISSSTRITIRQLLTHSSGIDRDGETQHWINDQFPKIEEIKKHVTTGISVFQPLEKFKYSNLGYTLLGTIIEKAAGMPYDKFIQKNILDVLKLKSTYVDMDAKCKDLATGYGRDLPGYDREIFTNPSTQSMAAATGFVSNVHDLCTFMSSQFLTNDLLLTKESKKEMQRIQWIEETNPNLMRGLAYELVKSDNMMLRGHGGGFSGFSTKINFEREKEIGVAVLTNASGTNVNELALGIFHIIQYVLANYDTLKSIEDKSANLDKLEGLYSNRWGDVQIVKINNSLSLVYPNNSKIFADVQKLKHQSGNTFIIETGDNFDYLGEKVIFNLVNGEVKNVQIGASIAIPFKEYLKTKKKIN